MTAYDYEQLFKIEADQIKYCKANPYSGRKYNEAPEEGILFKEKKVPYLYFPSLQRLPFIRHGFSTRLGGVSKDYFSTLNLSFTRGDDNILVKENYRRFAEALDLNAEDFVFSDQVHDTKVYRITEENRGQGIKTERILQGIDGLITNVINLPLVTFYADCVPLFFVDVRHKAIGLSHSGWRGTVNKIGKKTVEAMRREFDTNPEEVVAVIGPSICSRCYEVSKDVADAFCKSFTADALAEILEEKENDKYQLDLWRANQIILTETGIPLENISVSGICTCCNSNLLYSHRASGGNRGNLAAVLSLI